LTDTRQTLFGGTEFSYDFKVRLDFNQRFEPVAQDHVIFDEYDAGS
jgi:hypothetical protein